jgi:hypothetical protein
MKRNDQNLKQVIVDLKTNSEILALLVDSTSW